MYNRNLMKFTELNLSPTMLEALQKKNFQEASLIQQQVIPAALNGKDIIGQAQTGTGKTAAFGIPIIEKTIENRDLQHIILAPSRELAMQISSELIELKGTRKIFIATIIGGVSYSLQEKDLRAKPNIIIATPGRFSDCFDRGLINLNNVKTFVLDEADEMLNFGFYDAIMAIHQKLPKDIQTLFLTATFNKKTRDLAQTITKDPIEVKISEGIATNDRIEQKYLVLKEKDKFITLVKLLKMIKPKAAIIFGRTKRRVDELADALNKAHFSVMGIQGDMSQRERSRSMQSFRDGKINILVGTDVMARGIDVDNVDFVFNFDLPTEIEYYTHRIGRTGRANRKGTAISFVKEPEMSYFMEIMRETKSSNIEQWPIPTSEDLESFKEEEINKQIKNILAGSSPKNIAKGAELAKAYSHEELGIIVAKLLTTEKDNAHEINLTPEQGVIGKSTKRNKYEDNKRKKYSSSSKKENYSKNRGSKKGNYFPKTNQF